MVNEVVANRISKHLKQLYSKSKTVLEYDWIENESW